jgi:hypothetical protein
MTPLRTLAHLLLVLASCSPAVRTDATDATDDSAPVGLDAAAPTPDAASPLGPPDAAVAPRSDAAPTVEEPTVVVHEGGTSTVAGGPGNLGSMLSIDICPAGHVLTGLAGRLRGTAGYVGVLQALCRPLGVAADASRALPGEPRVALPARGLVQADDIELVRECAAGEIVVGAEGRSGAVVDRITLRCAPLLVASVSPPTLASGPIAILEQAGGDGGGPFGPFDCPAGEVASGTFVYHQGEPGFGLPATYIDAFGLACARPELLLPEVVIP